jgi:hypothetical protein
LFVEYTKLNELDMHAITSRMIGIANTSLNSFMISEVSSYRSISV